MSDMKLTYKPSAKAKLDSLCLGFAVYVKLLYSKGDTASNGLANRAAAQADTTLSRRAPADSTSTKATASLPDNVTSGLRKPVEFATPADNFES